jgi:hypothetical protein
LDEIFGTRVGTQRTRGLIDCSTDDFEATLFGLLQQWQDMGAGGIKFAEYGNNYKARLLRDHYSVRK